MVRDYDELREMASAVYAREKIVYNAFLSKHRANIVINDKTGCIVVHSPTLVNELGYTSHEIRGQHFLNFVHADSLKISEDLWESRDKFKEIEGVKSNTLITKWLSKNKEIVYFAWTGTWLSDDKNHWICNAYISDQEEYQKQFGQA